MSLKTTKELLHEVHGMLASYFLDELKYAKEEGVPMMSSTLSVIVTFLKNNEITADVMDDNNLEALREEIINARETRSKGSKVVEIAERTADIMGFQGVVN
ncbi:MAG: hypothetical protein ACRC9P_02410 [Bacteroides sp.]